LNLDEGVWFDNFYLANITPLFFVETLADLEKIDAKRRSPEQVVGGLAAKTPSGGRPNVHHAALCEGELLGYAVDMRLGRPVIAGGRPVATSGQTDGDVHERLRLRVVVLGASGRFIQRDLEVGVEIVAGRRDLTYVPSHALPVRLDRRDWRAGDDHERRVARSEMDDAPGSVVHEVRAGRTPFSPQGLEHEVVDEELPMAAEELAQRDRTTRLSKTYSLIDLHHRQTAAFVAQRVALPRGFLFLGEQLLPSNEPLISGHDRRTIHFVLLSVGLAAQPASWWTSREHP
jgi:hypothetical protein